MPSRSGLGTKPRSLANHAIAPSRGRDKSEARVPLGRSDQHCSFGCGLGSQAGHEAPFPRPPPTIPDGGISPVRF